MYDFETKMLFEIKGRSVVQNNSTDVSLDTDRWVTEPYVP